MTELAVKQQSPAWFSLRRDIPLTSSQFADAVGLGQGKPVDFLRALLGDSLDHADNAFTRHGVQQEPLIDEAYQLLTSHTTQPSSLWLPERNSPLHGLVAASPDRKVVQGGECIGLCEYKAPVHCLYNPKRNPSGVPRRYMAQIQGQMGVCGMPWCDFMAVCTATKEITLHRVYHSHVYWTALAERLRGFIHVLQEAQQRYADNLPALEFPAATALSSLPMQDQPLPGEQQIVVKNCLQHDHNRNRFCYEGGLWVHYDVLMMGDIMDKTPPPLTELQNKLEKIDKDIEAKKKTSVCN